MHGVLGEAEILCTDLTKLLIDVSLFQRPWWRTPDAAGPGRGAGRAPRGTSDAPDPGRRVLPALHQRGTPRHQGNNCHAPF